MQKFSISKGFYSKLFLISVLILSTFSLFTSLIVGDIARRYEQSQYFKNYDYALSSIYELFESKIDNFSTKIASYVTNGTTRCDANLYELLVCEDYEYLSPAIRSNAVSLLQDMCRNDHYLTGFLLYSTAKGHLYYYNRSSSISYLQKVDLSLLNLRPFSRQILSDASIEEILLSNNKGKPASHMYGIVGTLFQNTKEPVGYLVALYSNAELTNALNRYPVDESSLFTIIERDSSELYFASAADYRNLALPNMAEERISPPFSNSFPQRIALEGQDYFVSTIHNNQYNFDTRYQVPRSSLPTNYTASLIFLLSICLFIGSLMMYLLTCYLGTKKVRLIQKGMKHIGATDLSYRIPAVKDQDEFSQIISGFNQMCDMLQENVEKSYIYELQQKKAELYALQTSINPHFLYNTLEIIRVQITQGNNAAASQMILLLSKIYRNQTNRNMYVSIQDELETCENFMILYQYRFQNFEYEFDVPSELIPYGLPKNTLQPLIENYFVHGIDPTRDDSLFTIMGHSFTKNETSYISLEVSNNGRGISPEELAALKQKLAENAYSDKKDGGFALTNINNRLHIVFGSDCEMIPSLPPDGTGFSMRLIFPKRLPHQLEK